MGVTQGILSASFEAAEKAGATKITQIGISVGELTEVMEFALQFAFEALTPGTMAEGATLVVTHVPARSRCKECGVEYEHDRFQMICPECGNFDVLLLQGRDLTIDSIMTPDGEDEDDAAEPAKESPEEIAEEIAPGGHVPYDPSDIEE